MRRKALVVVLGELARSPRMQYHCISLANNNYDVTVVATSGGDRSCEELELNKNIKQNLMSETIDLKKYLPRILAYIVKPIWQTLILIYHLCLISVPNVIIIQNPPSIPVLPVIWLYSRVTGSKMIIDWHNYGFSILSLNLSPNHLFVRVSKSIEFFFGRLADAGFCVSEAMQKDLLANHCINYQTCVLYDRPPKHFKPLNLREKHKFYLKIKQQIPAFQSLEDTFEQQEKQPSKRSNLKLSDRRETRFTMADVFNKNVIMFKPNRPAIIMSSTSWTEDEDFDLLLEALKRYDTTVTDQLILEDTAHNERRLPQLVCVITGKGPLKSKYESIINKCSFQHVDFVLPWLKAVDYSKMVASCDLGISLHSSSSGVDLPMKVVDMFGCGIPVLAYDYKAINELVVEDFYGMTFKNSDDLYNKLVTMLNDFYVEDSYSREVIDCSQLARYKKNIKRRFLLSRWEDNWNREAKPIFDKMSSVTQK